MSGVQGTNLESIRTLLSTCSSWQTECGVATAALALNYIHLVDTDTEPDAPYAVVMPGDTQYSRVQTGGGSVATGTVDLLLVLSPDGDTPSEKFLDFDDTITDVLVEMEGKCDNGYALITGMDINKDTYGRFTDPERRGRGDKYAALVTLSFGVR